MSLRSKSPRKSKNNPKAKVRPAIRTYDISDIPGFHPLYYICNNHHPGHIFFSEEDVVRLANVYNCREIRKYITSQLNIRILSIGDANEDIEGEARELYDRLRRRGEFFVDLGIQQGEVVLLFVYSPSVITLIYELIQEWAPDFGRHALVMMISGHVGEKAIEFEGAASDLHLLLRNLPMGHSLLAGDKTTDAPPPKSRLSKPTLVKSTGKVLEIQSYIDNRPIDMPINLGYHKEVLKYLVERIEGEARKAEPDLESIEDRLSLLAFAASDVFEFLVTTLTNLPLDKAETTIAHLAQKVKADKSIPKEPSS